MIFKFLAFRPSIRSFTKSREERFMGDKGGKKNKEKGQKQKQSKHDQENKAKQDKQPKKA